MIFIAIRAAEACEGGGLARFRRFGVFPGALVAVAIAGLLGIQILKAAFDLNSTISTARTLVFALKPDETALYASLDRTFLRRWLANVLDGSLFDARLRQELEHTPGGRLLSLASGLLADGRDGKAVFVSPEQYERWRQKFEVAPFPPTFVPPLPRDGCVEMYFVQAVTGLPLILGGPPVHPRCKGQIWGQEGREDAIRTRELGREELCKLASERNLHTVLVLRDINDPGRNDIVRCRRSE